MNPFDLRGPEFLQFYAVLVAVVLFGAYLWRRMGEAGEPPQLDLSNPYLLACLREGRKGVLEVMVFSLVDRGLMEPSGRSFQTVEGAAERVRRLEEEAVLQACKTSATLQWMQADSGLAWIGRAEERQLEQLRLLPDEEQKGVRHLTLGVAVLAVAGVALGKVFIALDRGHTNVGFLILAGGAAVYALIKILLPLRTTMGSRAFRDLQALFSDLKHRAPLLKAGGGSAEVVMLAAMFGVLALPDSTCPYLLACRPPPSSGGGSDSSGSSSCGSSCGGGCGGGCGGCGS